MSDDHDLEAELRALGRTLTVEPVPDDLAERVLARVPERPAHPVRRLLRRIVLDVRSRRRLVAVIIAALIAALLLASPVRAAVIEWFRLGGVVFGSGPAPGPVISPEPGPSSPPGSRPPATGRPVMIKVKDVDQARTMIDFPIGLPAKFGRPSRVAVSEDRRLVELEFPTDDGPVLISQFDGSMIMFVKRNWDRLTRVEVNGNLAVWLPDPHTISYVDQDGVEHTDEARRSGPTLVYEAYPAGPAHPVTVRLEAAFTQSRAIALAESLRFP